MVNMQQAIAIIKEFVADVDAVGIDEVRGDNDKNSPNGWPDLADTYDKAKRFLEDAGHA